jgi:uncharacterized protein YciI
MSEAPRAGMESVTLVVLRRPADAPDLPEDELDRIQEGHLAFLDQQLAAGALAASGPFRDQRDETLRGLCVYRTGVEETRAIVEGDPAIRAGRMTGEVVTWWFPAGQVRLGA